MAPTSPFGTVNAPEFATQGVHWLNTDAPLSLADLRGRLVILDFWTFCCINCMHILPTLRALEDQFPEELAVIGVHTPKFESEKDAENVKQAISRYDIRHPVLHDPTFQTWQAYAVRAWPTLVFVAPDGKVIGHAPGEPDPARLAQAVSDMITRGKSEGLMQAGTFTYTPQPTAQQRLRFPGKVKPAPTEFLDDACHLIVADSGNHQIVLLDKDGNDILRIGSGSPGFEDGSLSNASFRDPQGFAVTDTIIYVADTNNHALRLIDLVAGTVTTLTGNGKRGPIISAPMTAQGTALASPWDVALMPNGIAIANAGTHQLVLIDYAHDQVLPLAGTGGEDIIDGPALSSLLAQPSGLFWDDDTNALFFADSETSALRAYIPTEDGGMVESLIGTGLFDFGHINGPADAARLQHALGVWKTGDTLLIADSYNHAIRSLDMTTREVTDWDDGSTCLDDVCLPLGEPAGVCSHQDGMIYLSDTNNHRIVQYNPVEKTNRTWAK